MFQISLVNRSNAISDREMHRVVRAINRQVQEDFEPYWAFGGRMRLEGPSRNAPLEQLAELRGDAIIYVLDDTQSDNALGYHARNLSGVPYGYVFLDLCKTLGEEWSATLSHETLELIADPQCNLLVRGPHPDASGRTVYHYFEMCDAVQAQSYQIDGVTVSDFVLPSYFAQGGESAQNDFCSMGLKPFGVTPGGYIGFFDPAANRDDQFFGDDARARRRYAIKSGAGSGRVFRRGAADNANSPAPSSERAPLGDTAATAAAIAKTGDDNIEHVVVLMLENRSFDHMLGALKAFNPDIDGVDPAKPGTNHDSTFNVTFMQKDIASQVVSNTFKVPHEWEDVMFQIGNGMGNFVDAYRKENPDSAQPDGDQVMAYFKDGDLPALHTLAKHFLVCDKWFSSLPGPTWPNRLFVHSGTSIGDVLMPDGLSLGTVQQFFMRYTQDTIYDYMDTKAKASGNGKPDWKIYHDSIPQSIVLNSLKTRFIEQQNYQSMAQFVDDCNDAKTFPSYAFIEPRYFGGIFGHENDQHSPAGVPAGETLIAAVYDAIRSNQALWESTLLIITYDEHGGFYDHVTPPQTAAPDSKTGKMPDGKPQFPFTQLGVRVPAILISPWIDAGVDHTQYDHTSILRYVSEKWSMPAICQRAKSGVPDASANFAGKISRTTPRTDAPPPFGAEHAMLAASAGASVAATPTDDDFHGAQAALVYYAELVQQEQNNAAKTATANAASLQMNSMLNGGSTASTANAKKNAAPQALGIAARANLVETWMKTQKGR